MKRYEYKITEPNGKTSYVILLKGEPLYVVDGITVECTGELGEDETI